MQGTSFEADASPSTATSPKPKTAASGAGKKPRKISSKRSATKATAKRKPGSKRTKPSKSAAKKPKAAKKGGRPMMFPDKTIMRMPAGYLKAINAKARAKQLTQGEYLRSVVGRALNR